MRKAPVILLALGSSAALAGTYLAVGAGVDALLARTSPTAALLLAGALAALSGLLAWAVVRITTAAQPKVESETRHALLTHLFALGVTQRTRERAGRLVNTATDGVERYAVYRTIFLAPQLASLLTPLLVVGIVAVSLDWVSALALAASVPIVPLSIALFQRAFKPVSKRYRASSRALAAQELDAIQGLSALVQMNASGKMATSLAAAAEEVRVRVMRYLAGNQLVLFIVDSVFSLGMITAATGLALWRYDAGALSAGQALALVLLSAIMLDPLDRIGQFFYLGMGGMASGREIKQIHAEVPAAADSPTAAVPATVAAPGRIEVDDVAFAWEENVPVLAAASLAVEAGENVVLTGESGAGKSTLSALLQGQRRPERGAIRLEGHDLRAVPLDWARSRLAVVEQTTYLFSGTLRENLAIANPQASDEEMLTALRTARLGELLERLPAGLDTVVGERGLALSGGEAQRLAVARALLKDAPILLLDEPTAHVDLASEADLLAALAEVSAGRTTLTISHRAATIAAAGRVVELKDGALL
ncbi:MAG: ABC transporter ATP-binding protein [Buchananella hordeovulneris]|nr:ABC transporter ATP-binding protein [Buchananella hordeovulneris]